MKVIVFGHLRRPGEWMIEQINLHTPLDGVAVATSGYEYLEAAREHKEFALVIGQYKLHEYLDVEQILASENIYPHRRVICAPVVTTQFLEWASSQFFDGVIDPIAHPPSFGEEVFKAVMAPKGNSRSTVRFPLTSPYSGLIKYRDEVDEDIVRLITAGLSNNEIAEHVFLSVQTVRNRISRMLEASGARNRTHLAAMYLIPYTSNGYMNVTPTLAVAADFPAGPHSSSTHQCGTCDCDECTYQMSVEDFIA